MSTQQALLLDKLKEAPHHERLNLLLQLSDEPSFWGNTQEAATLKEALELCKKSGSYLPEIELLQAKYHLRKGELIEAEQYMLNATRLANEANNNEMLTATAIEHARLQVKKYEYTDALGTAESLLLQLTGSSTMPEADALTIKASALEGLGSIKESIEAGLEALDKSREINYPLGEAGALMILGQIYDEKGDYGPALQHLVQAMKLSEQLNDRYSIALTHNLMGKLHWEQSNHPEAMKNYLASLKLRDELGDMHGMGCAYNNIANIYNNLGSYNEALKYYGLALQLFEVTDSKNGEATANYGIGVVYHEQGIHDEALKYHLRALEIRKSVNNIHATAQSYNYIGNIYAATGNYDLALQYQLQGLEIAVKLGGHRYIGNSFSSIGSSYLGMGKYEDAKHYLLKALETGTKIGEKFIIRESLFSLIKLYRLSGDFEKALNCFDQYHRVNDEIAGTHAQVALGKLKHEYNLDRTEKELEIEHLHNVELKNERDRSESLLLNILPVAVSTELKEKGKAEARLFDPVTILFTDFVGFTQVSELLTPQQLVDELHTCFSAFDEIISKYNIEKIKTMGDGFIAASGLPIANPSHAEDIIRAALEIRDFMAERRIHAQKNRHQTFEVRIGIHSGPVVAGIVGIKKFAYDIWGDTVNTTARMEQHSEAGKINISESTYYLVKDKFKCTYRGEIEAKHKGKMKMYFVE